MMCIFVLLLQGMQRRIVSCASRQGGELLHDARCQDTKPGVERRCSNNLSCGISLHHIHGQEVEESNFAWMVGDWGLVSIL